MRRTTIAALTALMMIVTAVPALAAGPRGADRENRREILQLYRATAKYHRVSNATADGFGAFFIADIGGTPISIGGEDITCFDSPTGGMGVHYVDGANIDDGQAVASEPEAMVYEVTRNGRLRLVALEYIVPADFVENDEGRVFALPELFGQEFHKHSYLPVYILHVWIWKWNPNGLFEDFNPRVRDCA